jgi:hypothetical protein
MSVQVTRWGSHDPRGVTTVVGKKKGRRLLSDTAAAYGSRARRRSIRRVVDTREKKSESRPRRLSLADAVARSASIRRRARTGWGCEAPRGRAPGSARRRGGSKVRDECAEPEDSFPRALARPLRRSSRSGGASRRLESADEDNPQEISPGRAATRGDREPCEALDSELSRLHAWTYLVATARARRTVRRPRREATEGLSAALDSEMAAMTGKAVVMPEGAESDWGGRGRQPGTRSSRGASGTRCASLRRGAARDVCAPRRVPNRTNEREERNALSRAVVCSLASPYGGGHLGATADEDLFFARTCNTCFQNWSNDSVKVRGIRLSPR